MKNSVNGGVSNCKHCEGNCSVVARNLQLFNIFSPCDDSTATATVVKSSVGNVFAANKVLKKRRIWKMESILIQFNRSVH
ncbi:Hypothetical predicted protein, partial [Olea europaea subsp. europaea]